MAKKEVRVTQGAYAKVLGVGQPTVSKAIAAGKISSKAWDGKTINVAVADAEWGNAFRAVATDEVAIPTRDLNITNEMKRMKRMKKEMKKEMKRMKEECSGSRLDLPMESSSECWKELHLANYLEYSMGYWTE